MRWVKTYSDPSIFSRVKTSNPQHLCPWKGKGVVCIKGDGWALLEVCSALRCASFIWIVSVEILEMYVAVMWSEIVSLRTRPVWDQKKSVLVLVLHTAVLVLQVWCCFAKHGSCHARRHDDLEGHSNVLSTIYGFSILCLKHHYCGDQQWRSLNLKVKSAKCLCLLPMVLVLLCWSCS